MKKTFWLTQHSPLIHFQHTQAGATLRASEVKPKLDRYLILKLGGEDEVRESYSHWLVARGKSGHMAFDYKLRLIPNGRAEESEFVIIGNPGANDAETAIGLFFKAGLTLEIVCLHTELLDWLDMVLEAFFIRHNFGKRGSKGLGSFTLQGTTTQVVETVLKEESQRVFKKNGQARPIFDQQQYSNIGKDNQLLKSGFNHGGYQKAKLFEYAKTQGLRWDKRKIKREINTLGPRRFGEKLYAKTFPPIDIDDNTRWEDHSSEEYRFFRAMLGLPELYEFLVDFQGRPGNNKYVVKIEQDTIKRFRSPLTFKYIDRNLYVLAEEIPAGMFGQTFDLKLHTKTDKNTLDIGTINTPSKKEFNLVDFLNTYLPALGYKPL